MQVSEPKFDIINWRYPEVNETYPIFPKFIFGERFVEPFTTNFGG